MNNSVFKNLSENNISSNFLNFSLCCGYKTLQGPVCLASTFKNSTAQCEIFVQFMFKMSFLCVYGKKMNIMMKLNLTGSWYLGGIPSRWYHLSFFMRTETPIILIKYASISLFWVLFYAYLRLTYLFYLQFYNLLIFSAIDFHM